MSACGFSLEGLFLSLSNMYPRNYLVVHILCMNYIITYVLGVVCPWVKC